jgi:hypothetical protein
MTKRSTFTTAKAVQLARVATAEGVTVTVEMPDGIVYRISPEHTAAAPETPLDAWRAKRAGGNERRS